jgi:hypothetical protein
VTQLRGPVGCNIAQLAARENPNCWAFLLGSRGPAPSLRQRKARIVWAVTPQRICQPIITLNSIRPRRERWQKPTCAALAPAWSEPARCASALAAGACGELGSGAPAVAAGEPARRFVPSAVAYVVGAAGDVVRPPGPVRPLARSATCRREGPRRPRTTNGEGALADWLAGDGRDATQRR